MSDEVYTCARISILGSNTLLIGLVNTYYNSYFIYKYSYSIDAFKIGSMLVAKRLVH